MNRSHKYTSEEWSTNLEHDYFKDKVKIATYNVLFGNPFKPSEPLIRNNTRFEHHL